MSLSTRPVPLHSFRSVRAGFLLCGTMLPPYHKPYLDVPGQLALLLERGMAVADPTKAAACLERIGYYRLSGYWHPLRQSQIILAPGGKVATQVLDTFRPDATFAHAVDLYVFDKRLRLLLLDVAERIEVALRVDIALLLGSRDPWAHRDPAMLHGNFARRVNSNTGRTSHQDWLARLDQAASRSKEEFVRHFTSHYSGPLPIWIAVELWDFGMLSTFLAGMAEADRAAIALKYGVQRPELLAGWMRAINHVRNICAHHGRLWNRSPADQPKPPRVGEIALLDHLAHDAFAQTRLYGVAAPMQYLLRFINPGTSWSERLHRHLDGFPTAPGVASGQTGFPAGWETLPLWS